MSTLPRDPQGVAAVLPSAAEDGAEVGDSDAGHARHVQASRRAILEAVGASRDVTFVRGVGNVGDQLIAAGSRALLAGILTREIGHAEVPRARGEVAVLSGGGAWCGPYHELMPALLPVLERRFARVVVLPSSFDVTVAAVRHALASTRATVFARERASFAQIRGLCAARLAHDAAFFFDFAPYRQPGRGTLDAFRTDREAAGRLPLPGGNVDVSVVCATLDEWLHTLARHALVRTDRAHVLIASALLGKEVEWAASSYHKVPGIAAFALEGRFPVRRLDPPGPARRAAAAPRPPSSPPAPADLRARLAAAGRAAFEPPHAAPDPASAPRVTAVLVSWNRPDGIRTALESIRRCASLPWRAVVVDNGSGAETRAALRDEAAADPRVRLDFLDRNRGAAGGRSHAVGLADTEYVFFLDDDAEIFPGTLEHLVATLDARPAALAAAANVVLPDGTVQTCGGDFEVRDGVVRFSPLGAGRPFEALAGEPASPCRWSGCAAVLYRRAALERFPLDTGMAAYYEDNDWGFRVEREEPGCQLRVPRALVLHHHVPKDRAGSSPADVAHAIRFCEPIARFYGRHGLVMEDLFGFVGELTGPAGRDVAAARLFCELLLARGAHWTVATWLAGGLDPLFVHGAPPVPPPPEPVVLDDSREELHRIWRSKWYRLALHYWVARHAVRSTLGLGDRP